MTLPVTLDLQQIAHFRVQVKVGEGGMGVVYRAHDEKLRRTVALKVLPRDEGHEERRARFLREARAAAAVLHPNIATVFEVGEDQGRVYIAMEFVEGETLRALLARGPLSVAEALRIGRGVARGIARAHERGIVHRDLKPDNVMLDADREVKILDFGLAKLREGAAYASHATETGRMMGTPGYMSPEQWETMPVDARTDVFSFGVLLYELVTGRRPFERPIAVLRDPPTPASKLVAAVPPELDAILARCLEKDPSKRFDDAGEVARALEAIATTLSDAPRALGRAPEPTARPRRGRAAAVGAGLVTLAAVVGYGALQHERARPPVASPVTPSPPSSSAPRAGIAMTDHAPPRSGSPAALAAYAAGLQSMRDGAMGEANTRFGEALQADPSFAAAQLRLALYDGLTATELRTLVAKAASLRGTLDARDTALLDIALAAASAPATLEARVREAEAAYPDDAEVAWVGGSFYLLNNLFEPARAAFARAAPLDPKFALPALRLADLALESGDAEGALGWLDRCLAISPIASTCMHIRAAIFSGLGRCADLETEARRMLVVEPTSGVAQVYLAQGLAANGASVETVRGALQQAIDLGSAATAPDRALWRASVDAELALFAGDLDLARARVDAYDRLLAGDAGEMTHAQVARWRLGIAEETGDARGARAAAQAFTDRVPALVVDGAAIARPGALATLHRAGVLPDARFEALRAQGELATVPEGVARTPGDDAFAWVAFEAEPARTAAEATAALGRRPGGTLAAFLAPFPWDIDQEGYLDRAVGNVHVLAGDMAQALPSLRRGAAACDVLHAPVEQARAHVQLGQALERQGDTPGACAAYRFVVERWPAPKPRSLSVEASRSRLAALRCR